MNAGHSNKTKDIDPNATSGEDYGKNAGRKKIAVPDKTGKKVKIKPEGR